jgi:hypothetical protein
MRIARKRCDYCGRWYSPHPRTWRQQRACAAPACRKRREAQAQQSWRKRHPDYEQGRRLKRRAWAKTYPDYWRQYRKTHPEYALREKRRMRRKREGVRRVANQNAISAIAVEKLTSIREGEPENVANHNAIYRRVDGIIGYLLWKECVANQNSIGYEVVNKA